MCQVDRNDIWYTLKRKGVCLSDGDIYFSVNKQEADSSIKMV